jgi:hypothetical protein
MTFFRSAPAMLLALVTSFSINTVAVDESSPVAQDSDIKVQATYVYQRKPSLHADYSGPNSLITQREQSRSTTATLYAGMRAWEGGELYLNPEMAMGVPFSNLTGLGGFTNGELAKTSGANPRFYRARAFVRQTWNAGETTETVESDQNQLAGKVSPERLVLTAGNVSVLDIFDDNLYSHEPRRQFLNWAIMTHGAWDYPADSRGYTWGVAVEYISPQWSLRAGRFVQPRESNGLSLNPRIFQRYGDAIEFERAYSLADQPGKIRLLWFRNAARMASFQSAIDTAGNNPPDISTVRTPRQKRGHGINIEQAIVKHVGMFARYSRSDGKTETYAFAEIDASLSAGLVFKGTPWARADDEIGIAFERGKLSASHQAYLRRGGAGFFLGDGNLDYAPEQIVETYYSMAIGKHLWLSLGAQRVSNPAYNKARGPASFSGIRVHTEF